MKALLRHKPSPAMVVALIALFVALGGSAYAGVTLSRDSVRTVHIKNNAVTAPKIKRNAVRASDIRANAVRAS